APVAPAVAAAPRMPEPVVEMPLAVAPSAQSEDDDLSLSLPDAAQLFGGSSAAASGDLDVTPPAARVTPTSSAPRAPERQPAPIVAPPPAPSSALRATEGKPAPKP